MIIVKRGMMIKICERCHKEYETRKRLSKTQIETQKFCGKDCSSKSMHERVVTIIKVCKNCGCNYEPTNTWKKIVATQQYCSLKCFIEYKVRTAIGPVERRKRKQQDPAYRKKHNELVRLYSATDKYKKRRKQYLQKTKEKIIERNRVYRCLNKDELNRKARDRYRVKTPQRSFTVKEKLNNTISTLIRRSLKANKNGKHWESLVGYTTEVLKIHLEKQFDKNMSWENQGSYWHIDHIIPISKHHFTSSDDLDFKRCWALKNLRPLEARANLRKHNKLISPFQPSISFG